VVGLAGVVEAGDGRLEDGDASARRRLGARDRGRDHGLADLGAGPGDEDSVHACD
jgi:hypothetical protein